MTNVVMGIVTSLFSIVFFYITFTFTHTSAYGYENFANTFWPRIILGLLLIVSILKIVTGLLESKRQKNSETKKRVNRFYLITMVVLVFIYMFIINYMGFVISTLLFLIIALYVLGMKNKIVLILAPLGITISVIILFVGLLYIPFPKGFGIFEILTLEIYRIIYLLV